MLQFLLIGLVFFAAHLVSSATGFGASVLGLPVLTLLVGLVAAKQSMVVMGVLLYACMTFRCRDEIDLRELRRILLLAAPGLVAGILLCESLPPRSSTLLLGLFVLAVAAQGLARDLSPACTAAATPASPNWFSRFLLFCGGLVHGAFTTGGPLLVVYCRRALPDKSTFRATLGAMWLLLGTVLMVQWTLRDAWDAGTLQLTLLGIPSLIAGMLGGEYVHRRVDARTFSTLVHLTLLATGGLLCWSAFR